MSRGRVEDIYCKLKEMAVSYEFRPGSRVNEGELASSLGVSRTPVREALNRLVAERLMEFRPGSGFFCRGLNAQAVFDHYELRRFIEVGSVRTACERASDAELRELKAANDGFEGAFGDMTVGEAVARDEAFHIGIARLTGNAMLVTELMALNERIRFLRWIDMNERLGANRCEHERIAEALLARDADEAAAVMAKHICFRMDQVVETVRMGLSSIYMDEAATLASQRIRVA